MLPHRRQLAAPLALAVALAACASTPAGGGGPLPSWREGDARTRILAFVAAVSDEGGERYVPPAERIAVFDNDGTLWCEKPNYFQADFMVSRVKALLEQRPELADEEPYASFLAGTLNPHEDLAGFLKLAMDTHTGMTDAEFTALAQDWLASARHPRFDRPYDELLYAPMLELLDHLRAHGFEVWICTGGGQDFVRCFAHEAYGVPPEQVIGTTVQKRFELVDDEVRFVREAEIVKPVNDKAGKPVNIQRRMGRVPILAVGNSDGDLEMMRFSDDGRGPDLQILVHHDDAEREYDYDAGTEHALEVAEERGWVVASIARDFARVFAPR